MNDNDDPNLESSSWLALTILDDDLDSALDLADDLDIVLIHLLMQSSTQTWNSPSTQSSEQTLK